jgi:hypothetical protein
MSDSHLKEKTLDRTMLRAGFERAFGPVVRQNTKWMNKCLIERKLSRIYGAQWTVAQLFAKTGLYSHL